MSVRIIIVVLPPKIIISVNCPVLRLNNTFRVLKFLRQACSNFRYITQRQKYCQCPPQTQKRNALQIVNLKK